MWIGLLNSSNEIIYGDMDENQPDQDEFSGEIEPEKKINKSDMEIIKSVCEYSEVDAYRESYA